MAQQHNVPSAIRRGMRQRFKKFYHYEQDLPSQQQKKQQGMFITWFRRTFLGAQKLNEAAFGKDINHNLPWVRAKAMKIQKIYDFIWTVWKDYRNAFQGYEPWSSDSIRARCLLENYYDIGNTKNVAVNSSHPRFSKEDEWTDPVYQDYPSGIFAIDIYDDKIVIYLSKPKKGKFDTKEKKKHGQGEFDPVSLIRVETNFRPA